MSVEGMAVRAVEESIEKVGRLESNIMRNEKGASWDGDIIIHRAKNDNTKKGIIRIPVQVKGKTCKTFPKTYSFSKMQIVDLENYLRDGGCVFFLVYINKMNTDIRKICYVALTPIEIKKILSETKKGQKEKTIYLKEFPSDNKQKLNVFLHCHSNFQKQHSFIMNKLKRIGDLGEADINGIVISSNGMYDAKTAFLNDDYCMYAQITLAGDDILLPIVKEKTLYRIAGKDANKKVSIDNKVFYESYRIAEDLKTESAIFGHSFVIRTNKETGITKIKYSYSHNIRELVVDLEFMIEFLEKRYFEIGGEKLAFGQNLVDEIGKQINIEKKKVELSKFKSFVRLLNKTGCKENVNVFSLSKEDYLSFNLLCTFEMGFPVFIPNTCRNQYIEDIVTINSLQFKIRLKRYNDTEWNTKDNVEYLTKLGVDCAKSTPYVADSITYLGKIKKYSQKISIHPKFPHTTYTTKKNERSEFFTGCRDEIPAGVGRGSAPFPNNSKIIQKEITKMTTQKQNYGEKANKLSSELWEMANVLRGNIDSSKFKDYIFGIIFYRFLSEKVEAEARNALEDDGCTYEEACNGALEEVTAEEIYDYITDSLGYYIKPENLFSTMIKKINKECGDEVFTVEDLELAIKELPKNTSKESEKVFDGLFDDLRLQSTELGASVADRTEIISKVMQRVNNIDFDMEHPEYDLIGTVYMILMGLFASDAGKKGGEFFTPVGPSKLCVELATYGLTEAKNIADCTCGSASMLLEAQKHLPDGFGHIYGQEKNSTTYNLAKMNMILHNVAWDKFDLYNCNTLTNDCYKDKNGNDIKMTVQVCNPPYSQKWSADKSFEDDPRYSGAGQLAPKKYADFAFLEHMIYHMDDEDGRIAVLLPAGVLFRGDAEDKIRRYIVKTMNRVDAVVMLPAHLFHGVGIPVCLMMLKSNRGENAGNILFIDASKEFEAGKKQNVLTDENIEKIVAAYGERKDIPGFAKVVSMEEIEENGYNLNVPRYVNDADEEKEPMTAEEVMKKLGELKADETAAEEKIVGVMKELGVA